MRAEISSAELLPAVLPPAMPGGGAGVVAVASAATIPGDGDGTGETQRPKPALSGTGPQPENRGVRGGCYAREGNHRQLFSGLVATGRAATKPSPSSAVARCSTSVPMFAGRR